MKRFTAVLLTYSIIAFGLAACAAKEQPISKAEANNAQLEGVKIVLSDDGITVDGEAVSSDEACAVYAANDIVYYEEGKDFTYGEGTQEDAHSADEAAAHTVVHITKPGTYVLSGKLSKGQVAVDLGEDAKEDPAAVVTLILNGVEIYCSVAPAVIFYNVYECSSDDAETAAKDVDTSAAGANVHIAEGTVNDIYGSYVARIYKPESVELNAEGTEVAEAKKLHKYDAAFYSKMSMNVGTWGDGDAALNISAENEGLDSELHLTINAGTINITSGNDGINTNEDNVSVTTINGGEVNIVVNGTTGEGDGIDSNGWLVINGGTVTASACGFSADSGIDSDMGIHVNGGTVIAAGNMLDRLEEDGQNYAVFTFAKSQEGGSTYTLKNAAGEAVAEYTPANDFSVLAVSAPELTAGEYTFWQGATQLAAFAGMGGGFGGRMPDGMQMMPEGEWPEFPFDKEGEAFPQFHGERKEMMPEGFGGSEEQRPERGGEVREEFTPNADGTITLPDGTVLNPEQMQPPGNMDTFGDRGPRGESGADAERSTVFMVKDGANYFNNVGPVSD